MEKLKPWRAVWHICGGILILFLLHYSMKKLLLWVLIMSAILLLLIDIIRIRTDKGRKIFWKYLNCLASEKEKCGLNSSFFFVISALITILLFPSDIASAALISLVIGDPIARIVGLKFGKHHWNGKTFEGAGANFIVSFFLMGFFVSPLTAFFGSLAGAFIEFIPSKLDDNLTIPVFAGIVMRIINR